MSVTSAHTVAGGGGVHEHVLGDVDQHRYLPGPAGHWTHFRVCLTAPEPGTPGG